MSLKFIKLDFKFVNKSKLYVINVQTTLRHTISLLFCRGMLKLTGKEFLLILRPEREEIGRGDN